MNEVQLTSQSFVSRSFAALFGLGGLAVLATQLLSHPPDRKLAWMLVPAVTAVTLAGCLLVVGHRVRPRTLYLLPPFGSVLVASASYGAGVALEVPYATFLFWAITSAFYFFPRRVAVPNVPFAALLYGLVLLAGNGQFGAVRFLVPMAAVTVSAVLIDQLNVQRDRLAGELRDTLQVLEDQARTDPVTGLPNRREFTRQLNREVARAQRAGLGPAMLMIDLDRFKHYNDTHGHPAGDRLLRDVARAWSTRLRAGDLLVRYGGDEFAVILPECGMEDAMQLAERLRAPLSAGQTCSVGVAVLMPNESGEQLVSRADDALLAVKRLHREEQRTAGVTRLQRA
jgi:diguanylate cyclase (GGDEF)-like protein